MTPPSEHDYIGLSEASSITMEASKRVSSEEDGGFLGNLKETELRLGLPGSESPERKEKAVLSLGSTKSFYASGAKRGFSDAIDGSGKWAFSGGKGSDVELGKGSGLFVPSMETCGRQLAGTGNRVKDAGTAAKAAGAEKKGHASPDGNDAPAAKAQVVGWPPIRSYRKNTMAANPSKTNVNEEEKSGTGCLYIKVSMDGAPYLRKVDLKMYGNYKKFSSALEKMFSCFTIGQCGSHDSSSQDGLNKSSLSDLLHGSEYVLTYEDKDGDWMLVGDVPWDMFTETCRRLRIMKGSEAIGLRMCSNFRAPQIMEKCESRN